MNAIAAASGGEKAEQQSLLRAAIPPEPLRNAAGGSQPPRRPRTHYPKKVEGGARGEVLFSPRPDRRAPLRPHP